MKNVKTIVIEIHNLNAIKRTPSIANLILNRIQGEPKEGKNIATVNHFHYKELMRMGTFNGLVNIYEKTEKS